VVLKSVVKDTGEGEKTHRVQIGKEKPDKKAGDQAKIVGRERD